MLRGTWLSRKDMDDGIPLSSDDDDVDGSSDWEREREKDASLDDQNLLHKRETRLESQTHARMRESVCRESDRVQQRQQSLPVSVASWHPFLSSSSTTTTTILAGARTGIIKTRR